MILLDTHIWIWWLHGDRKLTPFLRSILTREEKSGLKISMMSCWEVAKLAEYGRLSLDLPIKEWFQRALVCPEVEILPLTPEVIIESTKLPGKFHRDPIDQIIVATARIHGLSLLTIDEKILMYSHVETIKNKSNIVAEPPAPFSTGSGKKTNAKKSASPRKKQKPSG